MKKGRKIGAKIFVAMAGLEVGASAWVESSDFKKTMSQATSYTRMPEAFAGRRFACEGFTAVSAKQAGRCLTIVRIERTA